MRTIHTKEIKLIVLAIFYYMLYVTGYLTSVSIHTHAPTHTSLTHTHIVLHRTVRIYKPATV